MRSVVMTFQFIRKAMPVTAFTIMIELTWSSRTEIKTLIYS